MEPGLADGADAANGADGACSASIDRPEETLGLRSRPEAVRTATISNLATPVSCEIATGSQPFNLQVFRVNSKAYPRLSEGLYGSPGILVRASEKNVLLRSFLDRNSAFASPLLTGPCGANSASAVHGISPRHRETGRLLMDKGPPMKAVRIPIRGGRRTRSKSAHASRPVSDGAEHAC